MDEFIHRLEQPTVFSTLGANSGSWKIGLTGLTVKKQPSFLFIAFADSSYAFWAEKCPGDFHKAIGVILALVQWKFALGYWNEIFVLSKSVIDRIGQVWCVLRALHVTEVTVKLKDCKIICSGEWICRLRCSNRTTRRRSVYNSCWDHAQRPVTQTGCLFFWICVVCLAFLYQFSPVSLPLLPKRYDMTNRTICGSE